MAHSSQTTTGPYAREEKGRADRVLSHITALLRFAQQAQREITAWDQAFKTPQRLYWKRVKDHKAAHIGSRLGKDKLRQ
jgi:hypothetical protein